MSSEDREVAELVMGWTWEKSPCPDHYYECWTIPQEQDPSLRCEVACEDWSPTTDAAADYEVLCHVRKTWDIDRMIAFRDAVKDAMERRWWTTRQDDTAVAGCTQYEPGDYAREALATKKQVSS